MQNKTKWPDQSFVTSTTESEKETKYIKEIVTKTIPYNEISEYHHLLSKYEFHKTLRILAWINGFINNSRKAKNLGPLITERSRKQAQREVEHNEKFIDYQKILNLHKKLEGICEYKVRIEGAHSVYIPSKSVVSQVFIFSAHKSTYHRRATMTMTKMCFQYWIPALRNLVIFVIRNCSCA